MASYDLGDVIRETGTFTNAAGTATDPATVTFSFTDPAGTTTTYTYLTDAQLVKSATGVYYVDITASLEGIYRWRWLSTGSGAASTEGQFAVVRTTVRAGMQNLINRVRALTGAGQSEYTVGDRTYWTDNDLQDILDSNARFVVESPLAWQRQQVGGTAYYFAAQLAYRDLEEASSGTARWAVRDGPGTLQGTAGYSVDYRQGLISFTASQGGTAYYVTGYTYDVHAAAADVWDERLANFTLWYNFAADNQSFTRSQAFDHAEKMRNYHRSKAGSNIVAQAFGDLRVSQLVRVDLNDSCWPGRW